MHQLQIETHVTVRPKFGIENKFQCSLSAAAIESNELEYPPPMTLMTDFESPELDYPIYGYKPPEKNTDSLNTPKLHYPLAPMCKDPMLNSKSDKDTFNACMLQFPICCLKRPILKNENDADSSNISKLAYPRCKAMSTSSSSSAEDEWE